MKSLQLFIGVMCLNLFIGYSTADEDSIVLDKLIFKLTEPSDDTAMISVIFEKTTPIPDDAIDHTLVFTDNSNTPALLLEVFSIEKPTAVDDKQSIDFVIKIADWDRLKKDKDIRISLYSHVSAGTLEGHTIMNMGLKGVMDTPVIEPLATPTVIRDTVSDMCDLRITEDIEEFFHVSGGDIDILAKCDAGSNTPCYYLQKAIISKETKFSVCMNIEVEGNSPLQLCSDPVAHIEINSDKEGFTDKEITVTYPMKDNKIQITTEELNLRYEMVLSNGNEADQVVCEGAPTLKKTKTAECQPGKPGDYDILLVGVGSDNGPVENYMKTTLEDIELSSHALSATSDIIEVGVKNIDPFLVQMTLVTSDYQKDGPDYEVAQIDCREISDGRTCRGYFVGLENGMKYTVKVNPLKIGDMNAITVDDKINYISEEVPIQTSRKKDFNVIPIESVDTTANGSNIELDVCFKYVTNASSVDIQYEFLAVNSEGKWKNQIEIEKKDDSYACFHKIELPLVDFSENSKFFVLLRDSIKGKPLASGEVSVKIPAIRAIKPEVDNGNNGSTSTLAIIGAAIAGIACLVALVAAAVMFVMKMKRDNNGLQYPLHRNNIEDAGIIHGLDNPIPTM